MDGEAMNRRQFFKLLKGLPSGDLKQIQLAYWLTKNAHRLQEPRENGDRYFEHPREVTISLILRGYRDRNLVSLSLMHDVVEDTNTPPEVIIDIFSDEMWEWLYLLSKYVPVFDPATGQIYDRIKKPTDQYFAGVAGAELPVRLVKIADRRHNLKTMEGWERSRQERYIAETVKYVLPIAHATDPWFANEIEAVVASFK